MLILVLLPDVVAAVVLNVNDIAAVLDVDAAVNTNACEGARRSEEAEVSVGSGAAVPAAAVVILAAAMTLPRSLAPRLCPAQHSVEIHAREDAHAGAGAAACAVAAMDASLGAWGIHMRPDA